MRKLFLVLCILGMYKISLAQNTNPWPASGNVGIGTTNPLTLLNVNVGSPSSDQFGIRVGGPSNYPSLEFGIKGNSYDGMIATYGNDLHIYSGHWRNAGAVSSENHHIFFYTSQINSTNWQNAKMMLSNLGNLGIGTTVPTEKLEVNGKIRAKEIKVETVNWPDYVFKPEYPLLPMAEVEAFIKTNNHLPEIPSASEVEKDGLNLGEMNAKLLKKIEELTLYLIEQNKVLQSQTTTINTIKSDNELLKQRLDQLDKK